MYFCLCFGYHFLYLLYLHVRICILSFCYFRITLLKGSSINQPQLAKKKRKEKKKKQLQWKPETGIKDGLEKVGHNFFLEYSNKKISTTFWDI